MNKPNATVDQVINAVSAALDAICNARGVTFESLDETMIDKLLVSAFLEHLGDNTRADDDAFNEPDN